MESRLRIVPSPSSFQSPPSTDIIDDARRYPYQHHRPSLSSRLLLMLIIGILSLSVLSFSLPTTTHFMLTNRSKKDDGRLMMTSAGDHDLPFTLDQFQNLPASEREVHLRNIRQGISRLGYDPTHRQHGYLGLNDSGHFYYTPRLQLSDLPEKPDMASELREGGGFYLKLSDALPLDRIVSSHASPECHDYFKRAPPATSATVSVIIVFYNEPFSTLFRSVHSVLNYTPTRFLHEIVLVDDGSTIIDPHLEEYINLLPKTRLVRMTLRQGIVAARMTGIEAAQAPIFVVLDSHIECQPHWIEPIVQRISDSPTTILMPQIDSLNPETFAYGGGGIGCTLGFLWKLIEHGYTPDHRSTDERRFANATASVSSPTMAGGLFAADKDFFLNTLGGYDRGFLYWGTENLELSFRTWMCGGRLECAPCSRVYHIFRKGGVGYSSPPYSTMKNKLRLMAVWMDEFADLAWRVNGESDVYFGEYDELLKFRREKCKSFKWFLNEVYPESDVKSVPDDVPYLGVMKNFGSGRCLYDPQPHSFEVAAQMMPCPHHKDASFQFVYYKRSGHITPLYNDESCLSVGKKTSRFVWCSDYEDWEVVVKQTNPRPVLEIRSRRTSQCLSDDLTQRDCDTDNERWEWTAYDPPKTWTPPATLRHID